VLKAETVPATAEVAGQLGIAVHAPIFLLMRCGWLTNCRSPSRRFACPMNRFPGIEKLDFSRLSLYQTLREHFGIRVSRADEILEARSATSREAKLLEIHARASLLVMSRTLWNTDGMPVETAHSVLSRRPLPRGVAHSPRPPSNSPGSEFCLQISLRPHNAWFEHHPYRRLDV